MSMGDVAESSAAPSVDSASQAQSDTSKSIGTMNELAEKNGTLGSVDDTAKNSKQDEGVTVALPQSLFSEGMEHGLGDRAMQREMTEEERKAAAMKTIAQLQEWAAKANNSASSTSGVAQTSRGMQQGVQMNGMQNDNQVRLAMLLQQQQQRDAQQILLQQQQQQQARKRSDVLQRIIQDYLQGKQLSVYELQVLQQYIQQQQQQRTAPHPGYAMPTVQRQQPSYLSGNGMSTASAVPDYANAYYAREQRPQYPVGPQGSLSEAVRLQQERIAAAAAAGQAQARLSQIQREAMLAMHSQKPVYHNTSGGMSLEDQLLAMARSGSHTPDMAARINAQQYLNGATQQGIENGFRKPQYQQSMYGDAMRQHAPPMYYQNGQASMPANGHTMRSANSTQNLQDIGKTLAQLGISVEGAVNAGLLGGLSASDVRVVAESHRLSCERVSLPNGNGMSTAPPFAGVARSHSFGNLSAPAPSSPVGSIGNVSSTSLPVNIQQSALSPTSKSTSIAEDDNEQALLDQIISEDQQTAMKKNVVDEEWLVSKAENSSSTFNASQYGFFGQEDSTALSDELERYPDDEKQSGDDDKLLDYLAGLKLGTGFM